MSDSEEIKKLIFDNTKKKIVKNISILKGRGYGLLAFDIDFTNSREGNWKWWQAEYICPEHGIFFATGLDIRTLKGCPSCKISLNQTKMNIYMGLASCNERAQYLKMEFPDLDWSEVNQREFMDLDHTIRPDCPEHGEFITTPRKLFDGDKCKWCDGPKLDQDGNYTYKLSKDEFFKEKISIIHKCNLKDINLIGNGKYHIPTCNEHGELYKWSDSLVYKQHLEEVRDPTKWNSILFKINVMDKSSKFQFSIVSTLNINATWMDWYRQKIQEHDDQEQAQTEVLTKLLSVWFNTIFYNRQTSESKDPFQYEVIWSFWSNTKRIESLAYKYNTSNQKKELILASGIQEKIYHNLKDLQVKCYWSDIKWESTSNSVSLIRETILNTTDICPVCKKTINKPVVDHEHKKKVKGTGRIRDNICANCNVFIAKAENNCKRYNIVLEELPEVLKNLSDYFTQQQYNIIHYTDKDSKPILSKTLANKILKYWDCILPKKKKPRYPRSGNITKDWEEAIAAYEAYLKTPAKPFSKNEYKLLLRDLEGYNANINLINISLPKTKKLKLLNIPEYPKLKLVTPEIQTLMDILNKKV